MPHPLHDVTCRCTRPAWLAALVLAACSSAAPPRLHTLMPAVAGMRAAAAGASPVAAVLEPVRIPAQVDQPQWLVRLPDDTLTLLEHERWASSLRDELRQSLQEALITRWGMTDARPSAGAAGPVRIAVDVRRFDSVVGLEARLEGSWTLSGGGPRAATVRCDGFFRESAGTDMNALAAAHRRAAARLADGIGESLTRLARGEPVVCPTSDPS